MVTVMPPCGVYSNFGIRSTRYPFLKDGNHDESSGLSPLLFKSVDILSDLGNYQSSLIPVSGRLGVSYGKNIENIEKSLFGSGQTQVLNDDKLPKGFTRSSSRDSDMKTISSFQICCNTAGGGGGKSSSVSSGKHISNCFPFKNNSSSRNTNSIHGVFTGKNIGNATCESLSRSCDRKRSQPPRSNIETNSGSKVLASSSSSSSLTSLSSSLASNTSNITTSSSSATAKTNPCNNTSDFVIEDLHSKDGFHLDSSVNIRVSQSILSHQSSPSVIPFSSSNSSNSVHCSFDPSKGNGHPPLIRYSSGSNCTKALFVDCSVEYELPNVPKIPKNSHPLLVIHPEWQRRRRQQQQQQQQQQQRHIQIQQQQQHLQNLQLHTRPQIPSFCTNVQDYGYSSDSYTACRPLNKRPHVLQGNYNITNNSSSSSSNGHLVNSAPPSKRIRTGLVMDEPWSLLSHSETPSSCSSSSSSASHLYPPSSSHPYWIPVLDPSAPCCPWTSSLAQQEQILAKQLVQAEFLRRQQQQQQQQQQQVLNNSGMCSLCASGYAKCLLYPKREVDSSTGLLRYRSI